MYALGLRLASLLCPVCYHSGNDLVSGITTDHQANQYSCNDWFVVAQVIVTRLFRPGKILRVVYAFSGEEDHDEKHTAEGKKDVQGVSEGSQIADIIDLCRACAQDCGTGHHRQGKHIDRSPGRGNGTPGVT